MPRALLPRIHDQPAAGGRGQSPRLRYRHVRAYASPLYGIRRRDYACEPGQPVVPAAGEPAAFIHGYGDRPERGGALYDLLCVRAEPVRARPGAMRAVYCIDGGSRKFRSQNDKKPKICKNRLTIFFFRYIISYASREKAHITQV